MSTSTGTPSTNQSPSAFVLYRFFAEDGTLLYIGLTLNPGRRLSQHAADKPWWEEVTEIRFEHHASLAELREAERQAITNEKPTYNIHMNRGSRPARKRSIDPLEENAVDGLVGRYFHTFRERTDDEHATIINGRVLVWQGRILEEMTSALYVIETYSWWDGCATDGRQLARVDDMFDWRFYDTALEMQVALPCGESHAGGLVCRGEREFYHDVRALGLIHFICGNCQERYPGFVDYEPIIWRDGKPHLT